MSAATRSCDVLIVGTGGAAFTAALAARDQGLDVVMAEKAPYFGGTTATSGGGLWVPGTRHSKSIEEQAGETDDRDKARRYLEIESGQHLDPVKIDAFLDDGPRMIDFLEDKTHVRFMAMPFPDYHSEQEGASCVRSIFTQPYDLRHLGPLADKLKRELPQTSFMGMTMRSGAEVKMFFTATRSWAAFKHVAKRMTGHAVQMLRYGQSQQLTTGRALIARLAKSADEAGIDILLSSPATDLIREGDAVTGAVLGTPDGPLRIEAKAVILAAGGYARDPARRAAEHPKPVNDQPVVAPLPTGNTGDAANMAEAIGARFQSNAANASAWMPVSKLPGVDDFTGVWPHLVDRYKPGFVMVLPDGRRFANESASYHDLGREMIAAMAARGAEHAWIIGDGPAVRQWGIGHVKPWPMPKGKLVQSGYLLVADSLDALARKAGIDAGALVDEIERFNTHARTGEDPAFHRGRAPYDRYHGDETQTPNPSLRPLERGPFYAVKAFAGEIGNFKGLATDEHAQVLDTADRPIPGLYAVGNDMANVFGGAYPGGGGTLGPGMTFAYRAARHAADQIRAG
ncbi:FAD-dependent oxidoreductase [Maritimibacter sp. UBA3975]|uniref:FAD-dependent oxidoreductase n=1 Tax=Maritimibacter sp. UBA3975 TaxID=1946833 RepID=UPI000C098FCB|nr:FAD-dependent oxidoreductase [Maritimibacter sp. UBA3975]MAM61310.1 3-oxosteroid 1-dehydrogenase [Maritimibacter sp.]